MQPLLASLRAPRTFRSLLVRLLVVRASVFGVLALSVAFGQALAMQTARSEIHAAPSTVPSWSSIDQGTFPNCIDAKDWPANTWGSAVIGYSEYTGQTTRIDFDRAWKASRNQIETDDVTVLGICS